MIRHKIGLHILALGDSFSRNGKTHSDYPCDNVDNVSLFTGFG